MLKGFKNKVHILITDSPDTDSKNNIKQIHTKLGMKKGD